MIAMVRFTPEEIQRFEEKSIENMLIYYEDEMRRVAEGESPTIHLTTPLIRRIIDMGILVNTKEGKRRRNRR